MWLDYSIQELSKWMDEMYSGMVENWMNRIRIILFSIVPIFKTKSVIKKESELDEKLWAELELEKPSEQRICLV